mmetsp:Transcript_99471/g.280690  ORF Transcript_99471/g.280690 Transcript_99471/m.280690 type:complete len:258 (-) Transcript_99471:609-1382(-)
MKRKDAASKSENMSPKREWYHSSTLRQSSSYVVFGRSWSRNRKAPETSTKCTRANFSTTVSLMANSSAKHRFACGDTATSSQVKSCRTSGSAMSVFRLSSWAHDLSKRRTASTTGAGVSSGDALRRSVLRAPASQARVATIDQYSGGIGASGGICSAPERRTWRGDAPAEPPAATAPAHSTATAESSVAMGGCFNKQRPVLSTTPESSSQKSWSADAGILSSNCLVSGSGAVGALSPALVPRGMGGTSGTKHAPAEP